MCTHINQLKGRDMEYFVAVGITAGILASSVGFAAVAAAAPAGPSQVDQTVQKLQADGYNVTINRTGDKPLSECSVRSIRPGQTFSTQDSRGGGSINTTVTSKTVYLDVAC
jgi:hypothetical protein